MRGAGPRGTAVGSAAAVIAAMVSLAGCTGAGLPRTRANLAVCAALAKTLAGSTSATRVTLIDLESNAPISRLLRRDVASYLARAAGQPPDSAAHAAAQRAEKDCASIDAQVAKGYG